MPNTAPKQQSIIPLFLTVFIDLVGIGIVIPVLAVVLLEPASGMLPVDAPMHIRTLLYGLLVASYPFAQFFGAPILGALSDRHGRKPVLIFSLLGTMVGYFLFALALSMHSLPLLFFSRILDGFTGGNISTAMSAAADISTDDRAKARTFGLIGMAFGIGFIIGPFLGGKLADPSVVSWFNFTTPFYFAAILTFINIVVFLLFFHETLQTKRNTPVSALTGMHNIVRAFQLKKLRTALLVIFLLTLGFNFFTQFFQVYLIEVFQFDQGDIGNIFAFVGLCIALAQGFIVRPLTHKYAPETVLTYSSLLLGLTLPVLLLAQTPLQMYFIMPFIAVFQGLTNPNSTAVVSNLADRESQGEIIGIKQSLESLGMAIPPLVAALVATVHRSLPIVLGGGITLLAWLLFVVGYKASQKDQFHEV